MKSEEEIKSKLNELRAYLDECESRGVTSISAKYGIQYLEAVLQSTNEEVEKAWEHAKRTVEPFYYATDREVLKKKQEDFYNKNLKGKSRNSKKWDELWKQYISMDVREYSDITWSYYVTLGWVMGEKDAHGELLEV